MKKKLLLFVLLGLAVFSGTGAFADERVRIGVARFRSRAEGFTNDQAASISEAVAEMLGYSETLEVVDCDRLDSLAAQNRLNTNGNIDTWTATEMGKLAGCRYIVLGTVSSVKTKASGSAFLIIATATHEAEAAMDARIIDVATGEQVSAVSGYGSASEHASGFAFGGYESVQAETSGKEVGAVAAAASMLAFKIREAVTGEYIRVTGTNAKGVTLNAGRRAGVDKGGLYRICADGAEKKTIAVVKITDVKDTESTAQVVSGGGKAASIYKGDKASPISAGEAKDLSKRKAFSSERPKVRTSDSDMSILESEKGTNENVLAPVNSVKTEAPAKTLPVASSTQTPVKPAKDFENQSTDPVKVIPTYGLPSGEANTRRIAHIGANRLGNKQQAYDKFVELAESYSGDYLAAYRAGVIAQNMGKKDAAMEWFDKALAINPNYEPAKNAKEKLNSAPASRKSSKRKK